MKKFLSVFFLVILVLSINGCATLFKGGSQGVNMSSDPSGAKVYVNGQLMGTAPLSLELKVNKTYNIEFRKEGYESRTVSLNNSVGGGWVVLDILGGILPVVIDAATGNWYSLDQDHVNAVLEKQQSASK